MRTNLEVPLTSSMGDGNPTPGQGHNREDTVPSTCCTSSSKATILKKDETKKTITAPPAPAPAPAPPVRTTSVNPTKNDGKSTVNKEAITLQPIEVQALQEELEMRLREGESNVLKEGGKKNPYHSDSDDGK